MSLQPDNLLIIKHGALGDIILATGHIRSIRAHHPAARITVLTGNAYVSLFSLCPWVDDVWSDPKPRTVGGWWRFVRLLRSRRFDWVYDLQTSDRSRAYAWFMRYARWSGIGARATHTQKGKERHGMHTVDRLNDQLRIAAILTDGTPDISWLQGNIALPPSPFALIVPGGSAHRPEKRWPVEHYIALAKQLCENGVAPVLIGTKSESELLTRIESEVRGAVNLCDRTSFGQLATLARLARWGVGNDTGPMHIIAATNCPVSVIFSDASNPKKSAPRGSHVHVLQKDDLQSLSPTTVWNSHPLSLTVRPEALA